MFGFYEQSHLSVFSLVMCFSLLTFRKISLWLLLLCSIKAKFLATTQKPYLKGHLVTPWPSLPSLTPLCWWSAMLPKPMPCHPGTLHLLDLQPRKLFPKSHVTHSLTSWVKCCLPEPTPPPLKWVLWVPALFFPIALSFLWHLISCLFSVTPHPNKTPPLLESRETLLLLSLGLPDLFLAHSWCSKKSCWLNDQFMQINCLPSSLCLEYSLSTSLTQLTPGALRLITSSRRPSWSSQDNGKHSPFGCLSLVNESEQQCPTFLAPGAGFMEDNFSTDQGGRWFRADSSALHLLCHHWSDKRWSSGGNAREGSCCKYRESFLLSPVAHLLLCIPVPNRPQPCTSLWPGCWGSLS